jgi:hypothetical protein
MPKHSLRGVPDIILIKQPTGRFIGLGVKTAAGRLSPEQREFEGRTATLEQFQAIFQPSGCC